jgi:16S rRNA G1207 methylase RsmC
LYLTQLLRNDNPKQEGILQTRNFLHKNRLLNRESTCINGHIFQIYPNVFHAGKFPSTAWFANEMIRRSQGCSSFCEVGCGAGVIACLVALANPMLQVVATDLSADASKNTRINADLLNLSDRISVRQGDVLDAIASNEKFDLMFWALPFGFLDPGASINLEEAQVFDPGYRAIRKFLQTARTHLTSTGKLFLGFSSELGNYDLLENIAQEVHASIKVSAKTEVQETDRLQFEVLEFSYEEK